MISLSYFEVRAFRSCKKTSIDLPTPMACLIGPNGAGKTNFLNALTLLNRDPRTYGEERSTPDFACEITARFVQSDHPDQYAQLRSKLAFGPTRRSNEDILERDDRWTFFGFDFPKKQLTRLQLEFLSRSRQRPRPVVLWTRREQESLRLATGIRDLVSLVEAPPTLLKLYEACDQFIRSIKYCSASQHTNPSLCPTSFEVDDDGDLVDSYSVSRSDHTKTIFKMYRFFKDNPKKYAKFTNLIDQSGLKIIHKIDWQERDFSTTSYEVRSGARVVNKNVKRNIVIPIISIGDLKLSFNQLSEGTFRTIALLFHIVSEESRLLLIEEPEVGIHHGLLESVLEVIQSASKTKQIIFSTHSEAVVDQLKPEELFLVTNPENAGTTVRSVRKSLSANGYRALKRYLEQSGNLGEYWRHGGFAEWKQ